MKLALLSLIFLLVGCSHETLPNSTAPVPVISNSNLDQDLTFLKDCSQIRAVNSTLWLLTCQRAPHADRTEIYEWSFDTQKARRLTYQDGQIWDIVPIDNKRFYYSSSYDEFKEQFAAILKGAKPGADIYLKDRTRTDFQRITNIKGLAISFFWDNAKDILYFAHEAEDQSQILALTKKKVETIYSTPHYPLRNPVFVESSKKLYWTEYESPEKGPSVNFIERKKKAPKKPTTLFTSETKIFQLSSAPWADHLFVGFATGVGVEIWDLSLKDGCWKMAYRISEPVSEFYTINEKTIFLTVKNSLRRDSLFDLGEVCHPSPPGLGVVMQ
jgi:hypothetical protein